MPITVDLEPNERAILTFADPYTFEEWQAAVKSLLVKGAAIRLLVDRRHATAPTREFVEGMVGFLGRHADQVKHWRAAVVTGSDAGFAVARMVAMMTEARSIQVDVQAFRNYDAAERWLTSEA